MQKKIFTVFFFFLFSATSFADYWIQKADFGGAQRADATGMCINHKGYIGTGYVAGYTKDWWEYSPVTNSWVQKADYGGAPIVEASAFTIGNYGYVLPAPTGTDFWQFDPANNIWTQMATFAGSQRQAAVAFAINGKGYICGGATPQLGGSSGDLWEYDPIVNTWLQKSSLSAVRHYAVGFAIGGKGYIGTGASTLTSGNLTDFWEWDQANDTWSQLANFPNGARNEATGFSIGGFGYIGNGYKPQLQDDFWQYNPTTNIWTQKSNFGGGVRVEAVGFSIDTLGYIGTGWDGVNFRRDFWEYHPDSVSTVATDEPVTRQIKIYPNPFSTETTVHINSKIDFKNSKLHIIDANGKIIYTQKITTSEFTLLRNNLASGNYTMHIFSDCTRIYATALTVN